MNICFSMRNIFKIWLTASFLFLFYNYSVGQDFDLGSWNILNIKYKLNNKWGVFGEGQIRSLEFYSQFHYYEYKAGASFQVHPNINLTLGAGDYDTYKEGGNFVTPKNNDEFRLWPQVTLIQPIGNFIIDQRYRAEFRFTSNGYKNRFRYRLGLLYAFGKNKSGYKPMQLNASNELFFTDHEPYFERNRTTIALGYKISKPFTVQLGYVHQFDYQIDDESGRDFLMVGIYLEFIRDKNPRQPNKGIED
jgi:hypothetical protein